MIGALLVAGGRLQAGSCRIDLVIWIPTPAFVGLLHWAGELPCNFFSS